MRKAHTTYKSLYFLIRKEEEKPRLCGVGSVMLPQQGKELSHAIPGNILGDPWIHAATEPGLHLRC